MKNQCNILVFVKEKVTGHCNFYYPPTCTIIIPSVTIATPEAATLENKSEIACKDVKNAIKMNPSHTTYPAVPKIIAPTIKPNEDHESPFSQCSSPTSSACLFVNNGSIKPPKGSGDTALATLVKSFALLLIL
jgi:pyridoxal/pyridoxine/pyridoxamine kinase